jgi:site-specific DNA-methyltransferase (adenine-specific)
VEVSEQVRVIHGDCLEILPTLAGEPIAAVVTDPPYGMDWDTDSTRFCGGDAQSVRKRGHGKASSPVLNDDQPFDPTPWLGFPKVILWGANHYAERLPVGTTLVWLKRNEEAFETFLSDAEIAWQKGGHGVYCFKDLSMTALANRRVHPTQKPISLMMWCFKRLNLLPGSLILDPFAGSGTTGVACLKAGYRCILVEKDPRYIPIIHRRLAEAATPLFDREAM